MSNQNLANELLTKLVNEFGAKMNLEMARELSEKSITIYDVPIVEGSYTAAALLQAGVAQDTIAKQLKEMQMDK
ncbi:TPA_asm: hypothetical protein GYY19_15155 [Listeria monocytogenes]|nr:hypothetical protein [Listeria monocytogenes]